jgi:hypothetical protein
MAISRTSAWGITLRENNVAVRRRWKIISHVMENAGNWAPYNENVCDNACDPYM